MRLYKAIATGVLTATAATGTVVALPAFTETASGAGCDRDEVPASRVHGGTVRRGPRRSAVRAAAGACRSVAETAQL